VLVAVAIGAELGAIETAIGHEIASPVSLIHEMGEFIAGAGGKRLRPILLLIAARLAGYQGPRAIRMGCVVELLHTATLIHDDVVDQAPLRRGRPSANARWGDDASILVGDHLYSKSFALMVKDGDPGVLETLARATVSMTEAEVFQLERKRSGTTGEADYLRIITQKTASFMSACCRIGALLGRASPEQVEGLTRYGLDIGIAFQISDDSLDFVADRLIEIRRTHGAPALAAFGSGALTSTSFPRACGSHLTNSALSANRGRMIASAVTSFPPVPGLYPTMVASRVRTRGLTRSTCEYPRRQPRQVPYCSLRAVIPQPV